MNKTRQNKGISPTRAKDIQKLIMHARELVDYLIDDEARNYAECKDSAIHDHEYKHDVDNHIWNSVREIARITKYERLDHVEKEWGI